MSNVNQPASAGFCYDVSFKFKGSAIMWFGIPFLYVKERISDSIAISDLPKVIIESSFSWETIIAAFISGLVPSLITIYIIKNNFNLTKYQQEREDKRSSISHLRVVLSEYAYHLTKVIDLYDEWRLNHYSKYGGSNPYYDKMQQSLNDLERLQLVLLITIPPSDKGVAFTNEVKSVYDNLKKLTLKSNPSTQDFDNWKTTFNVFITNSNVYLGS